VKAPNGFIRKDPFFAISPQNLMPAMPPYFQRPDFSYLERSMQILKIICVFTPAIDKKRVNLHYYR